MPLTDGHKYKQDDPLRQQHELLDALLKEHDKTAESLTPKDIQKSGIAQNIVAADPAIQSKAVSALVCRLLALEKRLNDLARKATRHQSVYELKGYHSIRAPQVVLSGLLHLLLKRNPPLSAQQLTDLADWLRTAYTFSWHPIEEVIRHCERFRSQCDLGPKLAKAVEALHRRLVDNGCDKLAHRLNLVLGALPDLPIEPGEAWADAAIAELKSMRKVEQTVWLQILAHCQTATAGAPSAAWLKTATELLKTVGQSKFNQCVGTWFPLVDKPRNQPVTRRVHQGLEADPNLLIIPPHADILKGLAWYCSLSEDRDIARLLTALALSTYRKIPLKGPRDMKIGNAAVAALGAMPGIEGVYQLALLKARVKFPAAQKIIEKAFNATAARVKLSREELEEMAVPAYGLSEVGRATETLGDFAAELRVRDTSTVEIHWTKAGKPASSVPAEVKQSHPEELKELKAAAKDIERMLPAQRERLDSLFLRQKTWPFSIWQERYLDHPLVGVLARRILWDFTTGKRTRTGIWFNGRLVDLDLKPINDIETVHLWHPIDQSTEEIVAWRSFLDAQQIQQPFKQAHREIYLLTDAERATRVYSNRYAAHILRQHQFNALCGLRGWKNRLRLMVDDEQPPASLTLPQWNLRAEFWIEGVGDDHRSDTTGSGAFVHVATDQVRFHQPEAAYRDEPMPLEQIPPLVFSEVMRDVDMFVGVASVGNDPTWSDGGPEGRYRDYWHKYSFGDLSAYAKTRKDVLQRLVPKLKIASQCSFEEKFLVVKGSLRTYKIHLGSGNILMAPNDQYLCIVPKQSEVKTGDVFLPFEGDRTLSVIISKAFLLADDSKIKDTTITTQIRQGK